MKNRVYFSLVVMLSAIATGIVVKIIMFNDIPDTRVLNIHIVNLRMLADTLKADDERGFNRIERLTSKQNLRPDMLIAKAHLDSIWYFVDSAQYYFEKMHQMKNDEHAARLYFAKYLDLSGRFATVAHRASNTPHTYQCYLATIDTLLPGRTLPLKTEQEIEFVALLAQEDFYKRLEQVQNYVVSSTGPHFFRIPMARD